MDSISWIFYNLHEETCVTSFSDKVLQRKKKKKKERKEKK